MFVMDIPKLPNGSPAVLTGYVLNARVFSDYLAVRIRDITGSIVVLVSREPRTGTPAAIGNRFGRGTRILVTGKVKASEKGGEPVLTDVTDVQVLGQANAQLATLDAEMREQASRMLLSRVRWIASQFLRSEDFTEFESSVISSGWVDEGLEPLRVVYPGFGSPATLATSPAAQVMEFVTTTGARRAFTVSTSFSTTYRFPNGAVESRIIAGKAIDLTPEAHEDLLVKLSLRVLEGLDVKEQSGPGQHLRVGRVVDGKWPNRALERVDGDDLTLIRYPVEIPVEGDRWRTCVRTILHVIGADGATLVEGARETLGGARTFSSLTVYPSQFLGILQATPARQLKHLGRFNVWDK